MKAYIPYIIAGAILIAVIWLYLKPSAAEKELKTLREQYRKEVEARKASEKSVEASKIEYAKILRETRKTDSLNFASRTEALNEQIRYWRKKAQPVNLSGANSATLDSVRLIIVKQVK